MSHLQLLVGSNSPFFHQPFKRYSQWIEHSWLTSLWQLVSRVKFQITVKRAWKPAIQRLHDIMLMDFFVELKYSPHQLEALNRCRIYLQVLTLSDITSADGRQIIQPVLNGDKIIDRRSTLYWPTQQRPPPNEWRLWSGALQHLLLNGILIKPLQDWLAPSHQSWFWYFDPTSSNLLHNPSQGTWLYSPPIQESIQRSTRRTRSRYILKYSKASLQPTNPPSALDLLPVSIPIEQDPDSLRPNISPNPMPNAIEVTQELIPSIIESLWSHPFYKRIIGPLDGDLQAISQSIASAITEGTLLLCCDGSYSPFLKKGSHGWILATARKTLWRGAGPVDGHPNQQSPYRAELGGIVAILHITLTICKHYTKSEGSITLYCDCLKAIKRIQREHTLGLKHYNISDFDLLHDSRSLLQQLRDSININICWVKGHYTGNNKSVEHHLNAAAHSLANDFLRQHQGPFNPRAQVIHPPSTEVSIQYDGTALTSNPSTYVKFHLYADKLQHTICKSENWTQEIFHRIDWEAYKKAFSTFSRCQRIGISKLSHKLLNTNNQNNKYYGTSALCPCCQMEPESFNHMLSCTSATKAYRTSQLQELKSKITQIGTPEDITVSILHGIENWEIGMYETSFRQRAPTCGSVRPTDILIIQAYTE